jgi:hypothetical protein
MDSDHEIKEALSMHLTLYNLLINTMLFFHSNKLIR